MEQQYLSFQQLVATQVGIQNDASLRKQGEEQLNTFRNQSPNEFVYFLITILSDHQGQKVENKQFAASQIRKNLSIYSESAFDNIWSKLTLENKKLVQTKLFENLWFETSHNVRGLIAEAIGEIGGSCKESNEIGTNKEEKDEWPELIVQTYQLFNDNNPDRQEDGFNIVSCLLTFATDMFTKQADTLYTLFNNGMQSQHPKLKLAAIKAFGSYIEVQDYRDLKQFEVLLLTMLNSIYTLLLEDEDLGQEGLEVITDAVESEPKFFKKNFEKLFTFIQQIYQSKVSMGIKKMGCEALISLLERIPKVIIDKKTLISSLIEMIFINMVQIENEIEDVWKAPPEGFNEDVEEDEDFETTRFGMNAIDRLISAIGETQIIPVMSTTINEMLRHSDWRYIFAAIMALSQVGEYINEIKEIEPIVGAIMQFVSHTNPKIRYSVCHAIGQIADDMKPSFQEHFISTITPQLIVLLDDPVPRVASHSLAAITNLVEQIDKDLVKPFLNDILVKSFTMLQQGISIVKENAVSTIAATAEAAKEYFHSYFNEAMPILFNLLDQHVNSEYKQLRGQTIECITLISHGVSQELFLPYLTPIVNILIALQSSKLEQVDPQKSYVLSGWQRISLKFSKELVPYLPNIVPSLFKLVKDVFTAQEKTDEDGVVKTFDQEECDIAINMIEVFIDQFKESFQPYVEQALEILLPLCSYTKSEEIRDSAAKCLPGLVISMKNHPQVKELIKQCVTTLMQVAKKEYDTEQLIKTLVSLKDCIEVIDYVYDHNEIQQIANQILELLVESAKRKDDNNQFQKQDDVDDEEKEMLEEDIAMEEQLQVTIAELIGSIFKTHKEVSATVANYVFQNAIPQALSQQSKALHKFGIFLIDDMVDYLGYTICQDKWNYFVEVFLQFSTNEDIELRTAAIFGLGKLPERTPADVFVNYRDRILASVNQAYNIPIAQGMKEKNFLKHRDNCISVLGKMLTYSLGSLQQESLQQIIGFWLDNLPLKNDKAEGHLNHLYLTELATNNSQLLFSTDQRFVQVVTLYAQILDLKWTTETQTKAIKTNLQALAQYPIFQNNIQSILQSLPETQKTKLSNCIQNQ